MPLHGHAPDLTARATPDVEKVRRAGGNVRVAGGTGNAWWNLEPRLAPSVHEGRNGCRRIGRGRFWGHGEPLNEAPAYLNGILSQRRRASTC